MKIKRNELKLADIVDVGSFPYSIGTIKQIKDNWATIFRPYTSTADFSYTGGVICYIGIEEFKIFLDDSLIEVLQRKELK